MSSKIALVMLVVMVFTLGYLVGGKDTKECVAFGGTSQGKYVMSATTERGVWILDTQEGHLWFGNLGVILYIAQVKVGGKAIRKRE